MKITNCKLSERVQNKLLEFFVLQVTARSAADILGIQPNSAILFYRKIRMVISHYLALAADEVFEGSVELDESYFGGHRKGRRGRGAAGAVLSITASTIPRNLPTVRTTLTALKIFGIRQNASYGNTTESTTNLSRCS